MCKNLVEKGQLSKPLIIYNRTKKRADDLAAKLGSGKVASSVEEAVNGADVIFTCVGDDAAISETIDTALKAEVKGKLFVDCSTVHPDTTRELAKKINGKGAGFVAAPGSIPITFGKVRTLTELCSVWGSGHGRCRPACVCPCRSS